MMDNSYPMRHHVLPVFSRLAGARRARGGRVVACLACAVLAVSAGCRSAGGAEPSPSPTPLDGEVSVCGLATVDQIQQTTGRQIPSFAINNNPDPPDHVSLWCAIGVADSNDTGRFDLRVTTTYPRNIDSVPTGSTFEDVAAAPKAKPITLDSVPGQGAVIPDNRGDAILVWSYPDTDTVATLRRVYPSGDSPVSFTQDVADLEDLFTLIGPAAPQAADGPTQYWSMYPTGDHNPTPTP
ncbi:hypothetical protein [uncultured Actinomyces sp.]|uniref:hypothetical protein n=1 Tax=uncultured Actinomyces sp. TaxID=249061 RepID=UPI0028F0B1CB|nr:hypothetical protein [uncultured Actinomyces sp.]